MDLKEKIQWLNGIPFRVIPAKAEPAPHLMRGIHIPNIVPCFRRDKPGFPPEFIPYLIRGGNDKILAVVVIKNINSIFK